METFRVCRPWSFLFHRLLNLRNQPFCILYHIRRALPVRLEIAQGGAVTRINCIGKLRVGSQARTVFVFESDLDAVVVFFLDVLGQAEQRHIVLPVRV